ncbi:MAG: type IV pilin protein [Natronospirillum sp.]|nr:type IV pilin protein [Natronospirillum sp.]
MAQWLERYRINNNTYELATGVNLPFNTSPRDGNTAFYTLSVDNDETDQTRFVLQAVPNANTVQANDSCGTLTLNQAGTRGADDTVTECWR